MHMSGPQIDAIGVAVSDMALAIAFYSRLGLEFPPEAETQPHAEAMLGPSMRLMLDTEAMLRQIDPDWSGTPGGRLGLAVRVSDQGALDALYAELAADGLGVKEPWDASGDSATPSFAIPTVCTSTSTRSCRRTRPARLNEA